MRNLRIWVRLALSLFLFLLIILIVGIVSFRQNRKFHQNQQELYHHSFLVNNSLRLISEKLHDMRHKQMMIHAGGESDRTKIRLEMVKRYRDQINTEFELVKQQYPGNASDLTAAISAYAAWDKAWLDHFNEVTRHGNTAQCKEFQEKERELLTKLLGKIGILTDYAHNQADKYQNQSEKLLKEVYLVDLYLLTGAFLLTILITYLLLQSLVKPLLQIIQVAKEIKSGNLNSRCDESYSDEIGELGITLNSLTEQLLDLNSSLEQKVAERTRDLEKEVQIRQRAQIEIEKSEKLFRSMFESRLFGAAFWDKKGTLFRVNDKFLELTGYSRLEYEAKGINWRDITPAEYIKTDQEYLRKLEKGDNEQVCFEKEIITKDGRRVPLLVAGELVFEKPLTVIFFVLDISERKQNERELVEYRTNLEEKVKERTRKLEENIALVEGSREALTFLVEDVNDSRNEVIKVNRQLDSLNKELEAFTYSVSHDLKAPLRAIDGFSQALQEDCYDLLNNDGKEYIELVRSNAQKMGALINDLLEFSRLGRKELKYTDLDMNELVDEAYRECLVLEDNRTIEFNYSDLAAIKGDRSMMRQVMVNLISNALKYSRPREVAKIEIGSKFTEIERDQIKVKAIEYYIRDNGVGFDMQYYNKLFGVFQRLHSDASFEGTGVGLALIKRIIEKHNGEIWAKGKVDQGAEFHFCIPLTEKIEKVKDNINGEEMMVLEENQGGTDEL